MKADSSVLRIEQADRLNDGVIITFSVGKCAVYDAALLYACLSQVQLIESDDVTAIARPGTVDHTGR